MTAPIWAQDDPPARVARLGYIQGSVSFQPAGEPDWVQAVPNRPMTTGDQLWADQDSRAEVELGFAVVRLGSNTGFSFLNLDDHTTQIQLTSGSLNIRLRRLYRDDVFEVDTPNQAFSVFRPGLYRVDVSEDGNYTVVSVRQGEGESTGDGETYDLYAGQRGTFSGTESLNAEVTDIGGPDEFDNWAYSRDRFDDRSRSALYVSHDVVGYEDLDANGDWRDDPNYGHVWFPTQVSVGWAPYREGHWDWISPWGWTWVDDASWGYAPYHYGRWVTVGGRWGWVAGPVNVQPVYAPALVVFVGAGGLEGGGNVGWFPLGPREVYVPSYNVSPGYMNRVNVSNTTVSTTTITNVYNTTIINKSTTITNVSYVNKNVAGAVTAVPRQAFVSSQPVAKAAVAVQPRQIASMPVSSRAAVAPSQASVLGARPNSAGHVATPPPKVASRPVVAKVLPPPPPVPFVKQQQALAAHPGQPLAKREVQTLRPANTGPAKQVVKLAPPGKLATPNMVRPGTPPANSPNPGRPALQPANAPPANRPSNPVAPNARPGVMNPAPPTNQPTPNRPAPNPPAPTSRPQPSRPLQPPARPNVQPAPNRPVPNPPAPTSRPQPSRPLQPPARPNIQPAPSRPAPNPPTPNGRPQPGRPPQPPARPNVQPAPNRPPGPATHAAPPQKPNSQPKPVTPNKKKPQDKQAPPHDNS
ncbi:MAG TPA: DUF6600 domain-containing protein [Terriglobia bacterium]|nr:DUF6600 domain-containing protein [Terriglobia bacterium]